MAGTPLSGRYRKFGKLLGCIVLAGALIMSSGCANDNTAQNNRNDGARQDAGGQADNGLTAQNVRDGQGMRIRSLSQAGQTANSGGQDGVIRLTERNGDLYVPLRDLVNLLEFKSSFDPDTGMFRIGDNDVAYELKADSTEASKIGEPVRLPKPTINLNGELYAPLDAVKVLFSDALICEVEGTTLRLKPQEEPADDTGLPDFQDDPADPLADGGPASETIIQSRDVAAAYELKDIDIDAMIKTAHKYIGVPYVFGAKPYDQSKVFDCSSYVQYVFGKYGVDLPRLSRKQAQVGQAVSRTNLRKGDLLFFYLPGRYKSNKIVGHVGIYIGDGKMIHSSNQPKDGVQVTSINKSFWKKTYLSARRVVY